jgi:type IX secretion system PorP/SprF family membrane protein
MPKKKVSLILLLLVVITGKLFGQGVPNYNHYYIHPSFYNPSYLAAKNYTEVNIIHRQQWAGFEGAPVFSHLSLIVPFSNKVATGLNLYNNTGGILTTTSAQASFSYTLDFNPSTYFSFGLSAGVGRNAIDVNRIDDLSDPVFTGALDKSFFIEGQFGVNFQFRKLNLGVALPQLVKRSVLSNEDLQNVKFDAFSTTVSSASYRFDLSPDFSIEPLVMFKTDEVSSGQFAGYGTLYLKQIFWIGGGYHQDNGGSAYAGFKVKENIQIGYSYEFGSVAVPQVNNNSHEFRLAIKFGKRKVDRSNAGRTKNEEPEAEVVAENTEESPVEKLPAEEVAAPTNVEQPVTKTEVPQKIEQPVAKTETPVPVQQPAAPIITPEPERIAETTKQPTKPANPVEEKQPIAKPLPEEKKKPVEDVVRVVKHTPSGRADELGKGVYVIVGVFGVPDNAKKYVQQLKAEGYEGIIGYNSNTKLNYVHLYGGDSLDEARNHRNELRAINKFQFPNAWVLKIE